MSALTPRQFCQEQLLLLGDEDQAKRLFTSLSEGGQTIMPLSKTFFAKSFCMQPASVAVHNPNSKYRGARDRKFVMRAV